MDEANWDVRQNRADVELRKLMHDPTVVLGVTAVLVLTAARLYPRMTT